MNKNNLPPGALTEAEWSQKTDAEKAGYREVWEYSCYNKPFIEVDMYAYAEFVTYEEWTKHTFKEVITRRYWLPITAATTEQPAIANTEVRSESILPVVKIEFDNADKAQRFFDLFSGRSVKDLREQDKLTAALNTILYHLDLWDVDTVQLNNNEFTIKLTGDE